MAIPRNLANFAAGIDASNNIKAASGIFGTTPATTGVVRIPNDSPIYARNPGNDGDRHVIAFNSSGEVAIAGDGNNTVIGTSVGTVKTPTTISVGGATPAASGAGITFPADQTIIGASSDANTLDDYEEGIWTPTDASGASLTFTNNGSSYTKVGRLVTVNFEITFPSTANGSNVAISLPFTPASANRGGMPVFSNLAGELNLYIAGGGSINFVLYNDTGSPVTNVTMSTKYIICSFSYFT